MTIATAWAALAKQENAAYRKKWGTGLQQQKREDKAEGNTERHV